MKLDKVVRDTNLLCRRLSQVDRLMEWRAQGPKALLSPRRLAGAPCPRRLGEVQVPVLVRIVLLTRIRTFLAGADVAAASLHEPG